MTADPFEPSLVEQTQAASTPAPASPPPVTEPDTSAGGSSPQLPEGTAEGATDPVRLDRPDAAVEPPAGSDLGAAEAEADAGVALTDAGAAAAPDAGEPLAPVAVPLPPVAVPLPEPCPGEAFDGSCYEFFTEFVTWSDGEDLCVAWGGHLASVQSTAEDAFLGGWPAEVDLPASNGPGIWLGGTDAAEDGVFLWSDGSAMDSSRFAPDQPDNGVGIDCIEKRNDPAALWYDQRCTDQRPYVCERSL